MNLDQTTTPTAAPGAPVATTPAIPLACPECGEPARRIPPRDWPLSGWAARPAHSHADGTPLCPVIGPHGYQPAEPVGPTT